jgi:hypothetical protein
MLKHRLFGVYKGFFIPSMFSGSNHVFLECTKRGRLTKGALEKAVNYYYKIGGDDRNITRDYIRQQIKEDMVPCIMERIIDGRVKCYKDSDISDFNIFSASSVLILTKFNPSLKVKPLIIGETQKDGIYVSLGRELKVFKNDLKACIDYIVLCLHRDKMLEMQLGHQLENDEPSRTDFVVDFVRKKIGEK